MCEANAIRWFCVPFNTLSYGLGDVNKTALNILREFPRTFINYIVTVDKKLGLEAILNAGKMVLDISRIKKNGIENFRFGTSFNCRPHIPFFPFSYHAGKDGFSLAIEIVPVIVDIIKSNCDKNICKRSGGFG